MKPRVLIVDPSLRSAAGHHLGVVNAVRRVLKKLNVDNVSLVSLFAPPDFCRDENLVPIFEKSIYFREAWTRAEFDEGAHKFCADLRAAIRRRHLRPDMLILPAADQVVVAGLALYLQRYRPREGPEILIWIAMEPHFKKPVDDPSVGPLLEEYRGAFAALRAAVTDKGRLHVCCEMQAMSRLYEPFAGLKVETVTVDRMEQQPRGPRVRHPGEPINVVCVGNANTAKGYFLLPDTIEQLNRQRDDLRFLIHGTVEQTDDPESWQTLQRVAALGSNVTVRTDVLSPEGYLAWLTQADLVLLPYDPHRYKTCMSGIFNEAVKLGIPSVATGDCDFPRQAISERRAVGIEGHDAESVASAVLAAADRLEEISVNAANFAARQGADNKLESLLGDAVQAMDNQPESFAGKARRWLGL